MIRGAIFAFGLVAFASGKPYIGVGLFVLGGVVWFAADRFGDWLSKELGP